MATNPYQGLFDSYFQRTPDGRYFVPFSATSQYGGQRTDDGGYLYQTMNDGNISSSSLSPTDFYNQINPYDVMVTGGVGRGGAQNALNFGVGSDENGTRAALDTSNFGSRGTYNDQQGFFYSPQEMQYLVGSNPATTAGGKPNDIGLWQALSILAPAAFGVGSFALDQAAANATSLGSAGSATGDIGGSVGAQTAAGGAGADTLGTSTTSGADYQFDPYTGDHAGYSGNFSGGNGVDYYTDPYTGDVTPVDTSTNYQFDPYTGDQTGYSGNFSGGTTNDYYNPFAVDQYGNPTGDTGTSFFKDLVNKYGVSAAKQLYSYFSSNKGLGALAGGLLGSAGGSKPAGTTTTIQDIPDWQKSLLIPALTQSQGLLQQQLGQPSPLLGPAQDQFGKTIAGDYLNPATNPYLKDTYDQAAKAVTDNYLSTTQPRTDALFYNAGAFGPGNSAYTEQVARNQFGLGQNLKNLATDIYGGNYTRERQNQLQASLTAPDFASASYGAPWSPYKNFLSVAGGNFGNTKTEPYFTNKLGNIFSGALLGSTLLG